MVNKQKNSIEYFDSIAPLRQKKRKLNSYYWKDITQYCNYFAHDDFNVLEIGCGTGELLHKIKGKRKVGIDFSPKMIDVAKGQFPDIEFHIMSAEDIKLDEKFDMIILSNIIGYLDDVQEVFNQLQKVCHINTKIIVTYYNFLWEPLLKFGEKIGLKTRTPLLNWLSEKDINNLLYLSGFSVYRNTKRMLIPVNIPIFSYLFNKYLSKLPFIRLLNINFYTFAKPSHLTEKLSFENKYSVSVVIPARNESGNIENAIKRMPKLGKSTEIIFIEGNSKDDTWEKIKKIKEQYSTTHIIKTGQQKGIGKADAVRMGYDMATGDILMILDADLTVPPEDLPKFYDAIASGQGDFINGCRLIYPMEKEAMRSLNLMGNKFFSLSFSWLLEQQFKDTLCGTKVLFRKDYLRLVTNRSYFGDFDPFGDFDLIFGAHKLNLKIVEIPIRYRERTYGSTNISRFKHGLILLRMCAFASRKIKFI